MQINRRGFIIAGLAAPLVATLAPELLERERAEALSRERADDILCRIIQLNPKQYPFLTMLSTMPTHASTGAWFERHPERWRD